MPFAIFNYWVYIGVLGVYWGVDFNAPNYVLWDPYRKKDSVSFMESLQLGLPL